MTRPVTDLTRTRFSGGTTEFREAYVDVKLSPAPVSTNNFDNDLFPSQFGGGAEEFLEDLEEFELPPLPDELKGLQDDMHNWPLTRPTPELTFRSRLRRMASAIFSTGNGQGGRSRVSYYAGRPSDFTEYTAAQHTRLFGPADDTTEHDTEQLDSLIIFDATVIDSPVKADTAEAVLARPHNRINSTGRAKKTTGDVLRVHSRKLMVFGAMVLTVAGIGLLTSDGGGAESGTHNTTATASALPGRTIVNDYHFMGVFNPHTKPTVPIVEKGINVGERDGAVVVSESPTKSGVVKLISGSEPTVLPTSAEPIILAGGESVWDKVSERVKATGIGGDCERTNRTAQVVVALRALNPTKNLDVLSVGEHDLGFSKEILQKLLTNSSAC